MGKGGWGLVFFHIFILLLAVRAEWGHSSCSAGLLTALASLAVEHGSRVHGLQHLQLQSAGSTVVVRGLRCSAAWVSSRIRDQTCVSCLGKQVLYH